MKNPIYKTLLSSLVVFAQPLYADHVVKTFKSSDIKSLSLKNSSGATLVIGRQLSEVKVSIERIKWHDKCKLEITENSETLTVVSGQEASGFSFITSKECRANINVTMPQISDTDVESGSGDVSIADLTGRFRVNVGSGNLKIEKSQLAKFLAKSGSGNIKVSGEIKDVDIEIGSGDIELVYHKVPTVGRVMIKSGSGNATLFMPKESQIKVDLKAGSGRLSNELDNLQKATYSIFMEAGSGNLNVKKL